MTCEALEKDSRLGESSHTNIVKCSAKLIYSMFLPQFFSNNPMDRTEEIRMALDAYHREIAKLNQNPHTAQMPLGLLALQQQALAQQQNSQPMTQPNSNGGVQDLSLPKDKTKMVNGMDDGKDKDEDSMSRHSGSAFSLVRPKLEPGTTPSGNSTASSPLGNAILPPMTPTSEDFTCKSKHIRLTINE